MWAILRYRAHPPRKQVRLLRFGSSRTGFSILRRPHFFTICRLGVSIKTAMVGPVMPAGSEQVVKTLGNHSSHRHLGVRPLGTSSHGPTVPIERLDLRKPWLNKCGSGISTFEAGVSASDRSTTEDSDGTTLADKVGYPMAILRPLRAISSVWELYHFL